MKMLILGCNGMAGHTVMLYMMKQGHDVYGFDRNPSKLFKNYVGDATDPKLIRELVTDGKYDVVINCIGILNQYAEENKALAVSLNSYLPHYLADITRTTDTQIIHMSTDCVFSGKRGKYTENDFPDGTTFYDRSKALGELNDDKNLTLRGSIVGPDINESGIGLLNWFMKSTTNGESVNGYTETMWTGQTTLQLAKTMEKAALSRACGLVNSVPEVSISKYDLLQLFNKYLRNNKISINAVPGIRQDKSLLRTNFKFDYIIPDYENMVRDMANWIKENKNLYRHYKLDNFM